MRDGPICKKKNKCNIYFLQLPPFYTLESWKYYQFLSTVSCN